MSYEYIIKHLDRTEHNLKYKYGKTFKPTEITYHQTYNKATATNERNYLNTRTDKVYVGFHLVVDDKMAIECLPLNIQTWHSGDGANGAGNTKSIAVEIAYSTHLDLNLRNKAIENGAKLIAKIMKDYNIPMSKVKSHQARSGKLCPHDIINRYGEDKFRKLILTEFNKLSDKIDKNETNKPTMVKITYLTLNIRKEASFTAPVVGTVKKGEVFTIVEQKNGLGKLKSGAGWISLNTKYVKFI